MQIDTLDTQTAFNRISFEYPHLMIESPGDPIALIVPSLEEGSLPVLCRVDDTVYKVGTIDSSAINIYTLLRITKLSYHVSPSEIIELHTPDDIMRIYGEMRNVWMRL